MQPPPGYGPPGHGQPPGYGPPGYGPPPGYPPPGYGSGGYGPPGYGFPPPKKKSGMTLLFVLLGVLVVGFGGCLTLVLVASKPETPEQKAAREKDQEEAKQAREAYHATLAKIHESVQKLDLDRLQPKPCDGAKMKGKRSKDGLTGIHVVHAPYLERFGKSPTTWSEDKGPWAWITDNSWAGFFDKAPATDGYSSVSDAKTLRDSWVSRRYMVVVVPGREASSTALPKITPSDDFEGGYFFGWAVVYDQTDASIACQFPLEVESSKKVSFRDSGAFKESPEKAILADFQDNFEKALKKGIPSEVGLGTYYGKILR